LLLRSVDPAHFDNYALVLGAPVFFPVWLGEQSGIRPAWDFVGYEGLFSVFILDLMVFALLTYCILWLLSRSATQK
jgi:hypothetical protein